MPPEGLDAAYLWDAVDAAQAVLDFTTGLSYQEYARNRMLQMAVERAVEIIGEAARRMSEDVKSAHPQVPWRKLVAQRNVLAHEYGEINQERMWIVVTVHIPELLAQLKPLLPPEPDSADCR